MYLWVELHRVEGKRSCLDGGNEGLASSVLRECNDFEEGTEVALLLECFGKDSPVVIIERPN
jgi:hypothetical protein